MINKCATCRSLLDEEDLFCGNCGAPVLSPAAATVVAEGGAEGNEASAGLLAGGQPDGATPPVPPAAATATPAGASRISTSNFTCSGCGASMSYDASQQALHCPFCGSTGLVSQPDVRVLAPQAVVPFRVERAAAEAAMRNWLGQGFWRPDRLQQEAAIVKMTPVYVPYWVFSGQTHTYWTADSSQTPAGASASWYPLAGEHQGEYAGVLVGASGVLTDKETAALCPFDLAQAVPPEQVDLDNATYEQFSLPKKYARPRAQQGLELAEAQVCSRQYVPGRARNVHVSVLIAGMAGAAMLLPVWIMAYRFGDRVFRFLINGQTGQATGEAPLSAWKITLFVVLVTIGVVALGAIIASFFR